MDPIELEIHRLNTQAFIETKPVEITLTPRNKERTAGGGWRYVPQDERSPQRMRIIELGANTAPPIVRLTDGTQREASFWLLGEHDAQIQIDDEWTMIDEATGRERVWIVGDIVRTNHYEVRALVVERGK